MFKYLNLLKKIQIETRIEFVQKRIEVNIHMFIDFERMANKSLCIDMPGRITSSVLGTHM